MPRTIELAIKRILQAEACIDARPKRRIAGTPRSIVELQRHAVAVRQAVAFVQVEIARARDGERRNITANNPVSAVAQRSSRLVEMIAGATHVRSVADEFKRATCAQIALLVNVAQVRR